MTPARPRGAPRTVDPVDAAVRALGDRNARPDRTWIRHLSGATRDAVDAVLAESDELVPLEEHIRAAYRAAGRTNCAQIRAPLELYALARLLRPSAVVELGVSSGVSSAHFLAALARNGTGRLHSIDLPTFQKHATLGPRESPVAVPPGRSSGWAVPPTLRRRWDLRIGRSEELLPRLVEELPEIRLFLHDDLHTPRHLTFELTTVRPRLTEGAVVLADNTRWTGRAFDRFAAREGAVVRRRRGTDLVGARLAG
jgi:hypothetical protein